MISIIMPLYNAERFLGETLQSIANQTYKDYELICIDDASEDSTVDIVKEAQGNDDRIKLLRNEKREGAAFSRNRGVSLAQGDYISFLDGDDIFEEEMLEKAYKCAFENKLDIVMFEYKHMDSKKIYQKQYIFRDEHFVQKYCSSPFSMYSLKAEEYCIWQNGPCNKLFSTKFILDNKLEFQSLNSSNDVYFVEMAYLLADKIMQLDDNRVMVYARDHDTPTRISFDRDPMCAYYACSKIIEEISKRKLMGKLYEHCYLKCLFILLSAMSQTKTEEKKEKFYNFLKNEGICNLKGEGIYYSLLNSKIKSIYEKFITDDYQSQWFKGENQVTYFMTENEERFHKLFAEYHNILVWGAGNFGYGLIKGIMRLGLTVHGIIDANPKLEGQRIGKYTILSKNDIDFKKIDLVIVSAKGVFSEVKQELKNYDIKVIDLCGFIGM